MIAGRDFRHHTTVDRMQVNLAVQRLGQEPGLGVIHRGAGLVTARFDAQDSHRARMIPERAGLCGGSPAAAGVNYPRFPGSRALQSRIGPVIIPCSPRPPCRVSLCLTETLSPMPSVRVKENEVFDAALRRFKRACEKAGILTELRRREFYEKPTQERKRKKAAAVKRHMKRVSREAARRQRLY